MNKKKEVGYIVSRLEDAISSMSIIYFPPISSSQLEDFFLVIKPKYFIKHL